MRLIDADELIALIVSADDVHAIAWDVDGIVFMINEEQTVIDGVGDYLADLEEECENLSEYNRVLVERVKELEKEVKVLSGETKRKCSCCGKPMIDGFVIDNGLEYYCSEECLCKRYAKDEYMEMYDAGLAYWTQWEE